MSQVYSLKLNGTEIVSVEMDVPDFLPRAPKINREWLKGIVTEQVRAAAPAKKKVRTVRHAKHAVAA
jgi:hypothetical protein